MMEHELCVLFAYHKADALTLYHLELLQRHSPDYLIIPITDDVPVHLPGGVDVKAFADPWPKANPWRRCDTMLYRWFLNRTVSAKRYLYLEYDCLCTQDLAISYQDVWDCEVAARDIVLPEDVDWMWFQEIDRLAPEDQPFALGLVPLAGILFSHNALERIVQNLSTEDVFCELRMGTAARKAGLTLTPFPPSLRASIQHNPHAGVPTGPGLFHAVKSIRHLAPDPATDNLARGRPATQSSVSPWSRRNDLQADASGANNGVIDGQCGFHTDHEDFPWWQVDLESRCELFEMRLHNRIDYPERLRHFRVLLSLDAIRWKPVHSKEDDAVFGASILDPYIFQFPPATVARFVRIELVGTDYLHFCECEIIGQVMDAQL